VWFLKNAQGTTAGAGIESRSVGSTALAAGALLLTLSGCGATAGSTNAVSVAAQGTPTTGAEAEPDGGCWDATDVTVAAAESAAGEEIEVKQYASPPEMQIDPSKRYTATIETNKGTIEIEFLPGEAPQTVNNFVCLARDGFYDGTPFHRVVKGFMIQGGDPTGTGTGGPGYRFPDERVQRPYDKGIVAMANAGPNTNGSQFFIMLENTPLPPNYTIFGRVIAGQEVVDAIGDTPTRRGAGGENSTPAEPLVIEKVTVSEA
jgi:cyclophilin family peptidyl-prolyl cis-trans isomerase